jgi:hypothetical protein
MFKKNLLGNIYKKLLMHNLDISHKTPTELAKIEIQNVNFCRIYAAYRYIQLIYYN